MRFTNQNQGNKKRAAGAVPQEIQYIPKKTRRGQAIQAVVAQAASETSSNQSQPPSAGVPISLPTVDCENDWSMDDQEAMQGNPRKTRGQVKQFPSSLDFSS